MSLADIVIQNKAPKPDFQELRHLLTDFYTNSTKNELTKSVEILRAKTANLFLDFGAKEVIPFATWFDQLTQTNIDEGFIQKLVRFSSLRINENLKELVSFFKLDRFCELRSLFAALEVFPKGRISKPNSQDDGQKIDLIMQDQTGQDLSFQIKARQGKHQHKPGVILVRDVKEKTFDRLKQDFNLAA